MSAPKPERPRPINDSPAARKRWRFDLPHEVKPPHLPPLKK